MKFCFLVLFAGALLGAQGIRWTHSQAEFGNRWVNERYRLAMEAFPKMEGRTVFVLGASEIESGFDPEAFDRTAQVGGKPVVSYNFGFRNMSPRDLGPLIREMEFSRSPNLEIAAVYIKFSPADLTQASEAATSALHDEVAANILSRDFLLENIGSNVEDAIRLLGIKELQGGYSSTNLNVSVRSLYFQLLRFFTGRDVLAGPPLDIPRYQIWASPKFNASPAWDPKTRGFHDRSQNGLGAEIEELYRIQALPEYLNFNFFSHERRSQIISLRFNPGMIADFREQLENLRALSKNVTMFYVPDHPDLPRRPASFAQIDRVYNSLCHETGIRCLRFDKPSDFTARDYYDACHLNPAGVEKLSVRLGEDLLRTSGL